MCRSLLDHLNAYFFFNPQNCELTTLPFSCSCLPGYSFEFIMWGQFCPVLSSSSSCPLGSDDLLSLALFDADRKYEDVVVSVVNQLYSQPGWSVPFSSKANGDERKVHISLGYCIITPHWSRSRINCTCFIIAWIKREIGTLEIKSRCWRAFLVQLV